jgi:cytosine/adenosine deaminase-related metal-dependent hydrolase
MTFAGINYLAVVVAAVVAWLAGAVWYALLANPWVAAHGKTMEQFKAERAAHKGTVHAWLPFALAFLAELVMAYVLAGMVGHLGSVTIRSAVISGLFVWAGFMLTTMLVNNAFAGRRYALTAIDAGHWLVVVVVMGVVIGWIGV